MYKYGCIHIRRSEDGYKAFTDIIRIYNTVINFAEKNAATKQDLNNKNAKKKIILKSIRFDHRVHYLLSDLTYNTLLKVFTSN